MCRDMRSLIKDLYVSLRSINLSGKSNGWKKCVKGSPTCDRHRMAEEGMGVVRVLPGY